MITIPQLYDIYLDHRSVCTDSRQVHEGDIFFALKGDRFDGNAFAAEALDRGAAYAVIDEVSYERDKTILVPNVLQTLQQLSAHHRKQFDIPVLAITGSNGKTTTKELVGAVIGKKYRTHVTSGNLNNHIGVPLTLLGMPDNTDFAVLELGASALGEIDALCQIGRPNHGLITNIGAAHIEGFGSLDGVKQGKGELFDYLRKTDGLAFVPMDEGPVAEIARGIERVVCFSSGDQVSEQDDHYRMTSLQIEPHVILNFPNGKGGEVRVESKLFGQHNFKNIMAAVAIGRYFGVASGDIRDAIEQYNPSNYRSEWKSVGTNKYLMDCYNANPVSMRAAIESFRTVDAERKILILGDMLELGPISRREHKEIVDLVSSDDNWTEIWLVGKEFCAVAEDPDIKTFEGVGSLKKWFDQRDVQDTCFLLKGSRSIRLEALLED